jgi:Lysozyme like domain
MTLWIPNSKSDQLPFAARKQLAGPILPWETYIPLIIKHFKRDDRLTATIVGILESQRYAAIIGDVDKMGVDDKGTDWDASIGIFQIRCYRKNRGTGKERDIKKLADPELNIQEAANIYALYGWGPWSSASKVRDGSTALAKNLGKIVRTIPPQLLTELLR